MGGGEVVGVRGREVVGERLEARREELGGSERGQASKCVWGWRGGNASVLLVSFGALVTPHGHAIGRVSLKSWLDLFSESCFG